MTAQFPPEWVEAACRALVREQSMGLCDEAWPRNCGSCDCFRSEMAVAYERQHMQAVLEVVVPLVRADEARRIAAKIGTRACATAALGPETGSTIGAAGRYTGRVMGLAMQPRLPGAFSVSRWWAGLTVDHLYEDCPNRMKAEKTLRWCGWWEVGGDGIDPDGARTREAAA